MHVGWCPRRRQEISQGVFVWGAEVSKGCHGNGGKGRGGRETAEGW